MGNKLKKKFQSQKSKRWSKQFNSKLLLDALRPPSQRKLGGKREFKRSVLSSSEASTWFYSSGQWTSHLFALRKSVNSMIGRQSLMISTCSWLVSPATVNSAIELLLWCLATKVALVPCKSLWSPTSPSQSHAIMVAWLIRKMRKLVLLYALLISLAQMVSCVTKLWVTLQSAEILTKHFVL